jgi:hypothetical protein
MTFHLAHPLLISGRTVSERGGSIITMRKLAYVLPALVMLLATIPKANAAMDIWYQIGAGPVTMCGTGADAGPVNCGFSGGGVSVIDVASNSNSPGTAGLADEFGATLEISSSATTTLKIWIASQNFTLPTHGTYETGLSGTGILTNTSATATLQSCIDTANGTAHGALACGGGSLTTSGITLAGATTQASTVPMTGVGPLVTPYSLEQQITIGLTPGSDIDLSTSQSIVVPEPASILLFGSLLLLGATIRRRRASRS